MNIVHHGGKVKSGGIPILRKRTVAELRHLLSAWKQVGEFWLPDVKNKHFYEKSLQNRELWCIVLLLFIK